MKNVFYWKIDETDCILINNIVILEINMWPFE